MKYEWPGIATAVGVSLIVIIAFDLSKWQQLTAGLLAFGGGVMAYRGAMAKVDHDRTIADREINRRQLAILLQTDQVLETIHAQTREIALQFSFPPEPGQFNEYRKSDLGLDEQPDLVEIWANLDLFPAKMIQEIYTIRRMFPILLRAIASLEDDEVCAIDEHTFNMAPWSVIAECSDSIQDSATILMNGLRPLINDLAPELDYSSRMVAIYGEPTDEDR